MGGVLLHSWYKAHMVYKKEWGAASIAWGKRVELPHVNTHAPFFMQLPTTFLPAHISINMEQNGEEMREKISTLKKNYFK